MPQPDSSALSLEAFTDLRLALTGNKAAMMRLRAIEESFEFACLIDRQAFARYRGGKTRLFTEMALAAASRFRAGDEFVDFNFSPSNLLDVWNLSVFEGVAVAVRQSDGSVVVQCVAECGKGRNETEQCENSAYERNKCFALAWQKCRK